jgi:pimeloyl-ACP methyl ester carboxylesterase
MIRPMAILFAASLLGWIVANSPPAFAADDWQGAGVMAGGKGYAPTPMGQVSYRDIGPRNTKIPFFLIHQAWMSMIEFAEIQNALAKLGYRSIAVDTPGYGMSDPGPAEPTIGQLADNFLPVLDYLKVKKVIIAGHHTGALIAAAFAARHPERVTALILHGTPFYSQEEAAAKWAKHDDLDRTPHEDGSHVSGWFAHPFPGDPVPNTPENLRSRTWMLISKFMMGPDIGHYAVYHYDLEPDAKAIRAPTLILTDLHDSTQPYDLKLAKLRPDFTYQIFSNYAGMEMMNEPKRWAEIASGYAAPFEK